MSASQKTKKAPAKAAPAPATPPWKWTAADISFAEFMWHRAQPGPAGHDVAHGLWAAARLGLMRLPD